MHARGHRFVKAGRGLICSCFETFAARYCCKRLVDDTLGDRDCLGNAASHHAQARSGMERELTHLDCTPPSYRGDASYPEPHFSSHRTVLR